jgi:hypothetical protein
VAAPGLVRKLMAESDLRNARRHLCHRARGMRGALVRFGGPLLWSDEQVADGQKAMHENRHDDADFA